jgi:hypothetical protein
MRIPFGKQRKSTSGIGRGRARVFAQRGVSFGARSVGTQTNAQSEAYAEILGILIKQRFKVNRGLMKQMELHGEDLDGSIERIRP